jgi:TonB-linked SusC/RagA family outer membrane protein
MNRIFICWIFILLTVPLFAQEKTISGIITSSEDGLPLTGVTVKLKNSAIGTISDVDGKYRIPVPPGDVELIFSFVGYQEQVIAAGNRTLINIIMNPSVKELSEVVVTGYTTQEKKTITGSITSVSAADFKDMPVSGMDQALQGRAAGVVVTQSSGTPGGGIMIRVRGNSSISGSNRPLFIVDGVPIADGGLSGRSFGGQQDNALATLNPNDIESIEILKDASAKAIYGSRAANGVILITTKRGKTDTKTNINLEVQRGMIDPVGRVELLNSQELLELQREALRNAGQNPDLAGIPGVTDAINTDWIDVVSRTGILQQYQLSAQGGTNKTKFYLSGSYRDEEGVIFNNKFERWTGTFNLDHNATDKLRFGINASLARTLNKRIKGDNFLDGVYSGALRSLPWYEPYNEKGRLNAPGDIGYAAFPNFNPLAQAIEPRFDTYATKIIAGIYAEYELLPELVVRTKFNTDFNAVNEDQFEPSTTAIGGFLPNVGGQGYGVYSTSEFATLLNTTLITYNKVKGNHQFGGLLGSEVLSSTGRSSNVQGILFPNDRLSYLTSSGLILDGSSFLIQNGLVSYFGEVNYNYKEKYLLKVNARYDGSSRFGRDRRFGFFPAVSLGWRITEEEFMKKFEFISEMKLRGSVGVTGNERIGNFLFLESWGAATAYNGVPAIAPATLANPLLQWEQTTEVNLGLDMGFFENRISFNAEVYYNQTNNLLLSETLPLTTGFGAVQGNLGQLTNKGAELTISTENLNKKLRWNTSFNISTNFNIVNRLATDEPQFAGYSTFTNSTHIVTPGHPLGSFWGLKFLGVDPATGDAIYEDVNQDGVITASDGQIIGNAQPLFTGGLSNSFSFKNFDLTAFFQFSYGNSMINFANTGMLNSGESLDENQIATARNRWRQPGDIASVPRYEFGNTFNNRFSSRFVEDGSFLRLKNVALGYTLPRAMAARYKLQSVRIFASGTNLWTLTRYTGADPEVNTLDGSTLAQGIDFYTLPQVRTLMMGINIGL